MKIPAKHENSSKHIVFVIGLLLNLIVGTVDFLTGLEIGLSVFYLMPIGFVVWYGGRASGYLMSALSTLTMIASDVLGGHISHSPAVEAWNSFVHFVFFIVVTFLVSRLKYDLDERAKIIAELKRALEEIKTLSGLLPICAWCKKVRDDKGYWKQVEHYVAEHTEAEFTHGICPDCLKKLEPELYEKIKRQEQGVLDDENDG